MAKDKAVFLDKMGGVAWMDHVFGLCVDEFSQPEISEVAIIQKRHGRDLQNSGILRSCVHKSALRSIKVHPTGLKSAL